MSTSGTIVRILSDQRGGLASLGRELGEISGRPAPTHRRVWNWTVRGVPSDWRYWVARLAARHVPNFDEAGFMRGGPSAESEAA